LKIGFAWISIGTRTYYERRDVQIWFPNNSCQAPICTEPANTDLAAIAKEIKTQLEIENKE